MQIVGKLTVKCRKLVDPGFIDLKEVVFALKSHIDCQCHIFELLLLDANAIQRLQTWMLKMKNRSHSPLPSYV
jgi:hypothetical protein